MLKPLLDRVLVEVDDSIAETSLYIPIRTDKWTAREGKVESYNRGRVVSCGPGKRHPESRQCMRMDFQHPTEGRRCVKENDVVRFSELEYPEHKEGGKRYVLICEGDIVGVEA
jgi:co-chaperonin GroES (HSP10)